MANPTCADPLQVENQVLFFSASSIEVRLCLQLNTSLFAKTLVRKDVASSSASASGDHSNALPAKKTTQNPNQPVNGNAQTKKDDAQAKEDDEGGFSSKAQVMTLMTTDVGRVGSFSLNAFSLIGAFACSKLCRSAC
jgi:hypothetical protein